MKFRDGRCHISKNTKFGFIFKIICVLILIVIQTVETNKIVNFKNSQYLLDFKYYHTTENIDKELNKIVQECPNLFREVTYDDFFNIPAKDRKENTKLLKFYDITDPSEQNTINKKDNIFILSGEHPRELIAVETTFLFLQFICKNKDSEQIKSLLKKNILRINVNANPYKRMEVEKGDFCIRGNPNNVDINRNWDFYWGKNIETAEENPGKKPFSELETLFIKESIQRFKPKLFLTIHSGEYSLFHPYAFLDEKTDNKTVIKNKDKMLNILNQLKKEVCPVCAVGNPVGILGYKASGSCMDYVFEKFQVPYSLAWEIYTNEKEFKQMNDYINIQKSQNNNTNNLKNSSTNKTNYQPNITNHKSFLESSTQVYLKEQSYRKLLKARDFSEKENKMCFKLFNPERKETYDYIIETWRKAIIKLVELVNSN